MKVLATLQADLDESSIGTRCRLADDLAGEPVLRRTVDRALACRNIHEVLVICPQHQVDACARLVARTDVRVLGSAASEAPWAGLVRRARRWSLLGWRGGLGGATFYDEFVDCRILAGVLSDVEADAVLAVPPAAPLFDPALADRMIEQKMEMEQDFRLVFCQTPPGLSGIVLDRALIQELAAANSPVGWAFTYQPDAPRRDLIFEACCLEVPREVRHAVGRLSVDSDRSTALVEECIRSNSEFNAKQIGAWLLERGAAYIDPLPREVEIELTTDDPYPDTLLRPRGALVQSRGPMDKGVVIDVVRAICQSDDALLMLGGFGDPIRHPSLGDILQAIREAAQTPNPLFGLAIRTSGLDLSPDIIRTLIDYDVDVLEITLDAWSDDLYARLQSPDRPANVQLESVLKAIDMVAAIRAEVGCVHPIVVPSFTKALDNVHELDEFHDGWIRRLGTVMIGAASSYAGQFEDRRVIDMAPAARSVCNRLSSRCVVLADGRVTLCDQDINGRLAVGRLPEQSIQELWLGAPYTEVRRAHERGRAAQLPLCGQCAEWHRP